VLPAVPGAGEAAPILPDRSLVHSFLVHSFHSFPGRPELWNTLPSGAEVKEFIS